MVTHEWMVKPTPQTEWIERRGILVWIAEVFTSLGAGLYLASLFYNNLWGMAAAWLIIMFLKVPLHLAYFGKPLRFWRTLIPITSSWKTSWFTRGINFTIYFGTIVFFQIIVTYVATNVFPGTGWAVWDIALRVLGSIFAFLVGIYSGFIMSYCRSVPFWNSALLPLVFLFAGIADGLALIIAIGLGDAQVDIAAAEAGSRMILTINAIIVAAYLWNATYTHKTAKHSPSTGIETLFHRRQQHNHGDRDIGRQQQVHKRRRQRDHDHQNAGDDPHRQNQILDSGPWAHRRIARHDARSHPFLRTLYQFRKICLR